MPMLRNRLLKASSWASACCFASLGHAAAPDFSRCEAILTPYSAVYASSFRGIPMRGERQLTRETDGTFVLSHEAKALGSRFTERSFFTLDGGDLRVRRYDYLRSILGISKEDHAVFDWDAGSISTHGRSDRELPLSADIFDNLSQQLAIRCSAAQGQATMRYSVVKRSRIKDYAYERVGEETIKTDLGELDTVVLRRVHDTNKRTTRVWLAPELNFMLVRLHQTESKDGLDVRLDLSKVTFDILD